MPISQINSASIADGSVVATDIGPATITNAKLVNSSVTINGQSVSLGSSASLVSIQWQAVKTSDFSATAGQGYFCDTTSNTITVTLPASPTSGDTIALVDYARTFATYNLTVGRNGNKIQGVASNSVISTSGASLYIVYMDATNGWVYTNQSNVGLLGPLFITATGGTVLTSGNYKTHVFTNCGTFTVSQLGNGPTMASGGPVNVDYLVVAGGASGGNAQGAGGGGAGGYRTTFPSPGCAGSFPVSVTSYPISVGAGGAQSCSSPSFGNSGSSSSFSTITSAGGGFGGRGNNGQVNTGGCGGSGGGGGSGPSPGTGPNGSVSASTAGTGNVPSVSPPQGNPGGYGLIKRYQYQGGGGGGGASTAGTPGEGPVSGPGGAGSSILCSVFGPTAPSYGTPGPSPTGRYFAGGGGGGGDSGIGTGGVGGGGQGNGSSTAGTANTGGGGGAQSSRAGGKGIVVIRYKYQ